MLTISFSQLTLGAQKYNDFLLSFTAHWVDHDTFHRFLVVLQVQPLEQRHAGEYIAIKISNNLNDRDRNK